MIEMIKLSNDLKQTCFKKTFILFSLQAKGTREAMVLQQKLWI